MIINGKNEKSLNIARVAGTVMLLAAFVLVEGCGKSKPAPKPYKPPQPTAKQPKPYKVLGQWYQPIADSQGFVQDGTASWYGKQFHGRKTANGETYNMYGISAAHKTLPLGTFVRVHNLDNSRRLDVRINDRGPFVHGRIIDLSYGAAKKLKVLGPGTARVRIVALGKAAKTPGKGGKPTYAPVDYYAGNFTFQVGAFKNYANAARLREKLARVYENAHITTFDSGDGVFYRVRVGRFSTLQKARSYEKTLVDDGFTDPFIVAE